MISEKIVAALTKLGLHDVVIGMEATSAVVKGGVIKNLLLTVCSGCQSES